MQLVMVPYKDKWILANYCDGKCQGIHVDSMNQESSLGNIYVGRVENIVKNIRSCFVKISPDCTCHLSWADCIMGDSLRAGDLVVVQVVKEAMKTKLASVTTKLTLTGRYMVLLYGDSTVRLSRKICEQDEKSRLHKLGKSMKSDSMGVLFRTSAQSVPDSIIREEFCLLEEKMNHIFKYSDQRTAFTVLNKVAPYYIQYAEDCLNKGYDEVVVEDEEAYAILCETLPGNRDKIRFYKDSYSLTKLMGLEQCLKQALEPKVWLKSGGSIVIQPTEALVSIDVNTEKAIAGNRSPEATFFKVNMEAASEIARQLRIRNLSGIIIVDFIDMKEEAHRNALLVAFRKYLIEDEVKTILIDMTPLGLVELTRMKKRKPLHEEI